MGFLSNGNYLYLVFLFYFDSYSVNTEDISHLREALLHGHGLIKVRVNYTILSYHYDSKSFE